MFCGFKLYWFVHLWIFGICFKVDSNEEKLKFDLSNKNKDVIHAHITAENTLLALEKITFYYYKHKKEATIDFAFGMRLAEGEIARILHLAEIGAYTDVNNPAELKKLNSILISIQTNIKQSLPYIEMKDRKYFKDFFPLIKEKWSAYQFPPQYSVRDLSVFPNITKDDMDENESDKCMIELMNGEENNLCEIDSCWKMMTDMGKSRYHNTHQILWLLLGDKIGCRKIMDEKAKQQGFELGIDDLLRRKCAGTIIEMEAITQDGYRSGMIDLFLEQGAICGSLGFMDAVRPQWLELAFQWQDPNLGCFVDHAPWEEGDEDSEFKFWIDYKREEWKARHLLVDSVIDDGCSTHMTAVGAGFFAAYLRLFYDPFYRKNQLNPFIHPEVKIVTPPYTWKSGLKIFLFITCAFIATLLEFKKRIILKMYGFVIRFCCDLKQKIWTKKSLNVNRV